MSWLAFTLHIFITSPKLTTSFNTNTHFGRIFITGFTCTYYQIFRNISTGFRIINFLGIVFSGL